MEKVREMTPGSVNPSPELSSKLLTVYSQQKPYHPRGEKLVQGEGGMGAGNLSYYNDL